MPKIKIPRKNISLDMTAMCDMAFLLLTFFILTTKFKPQEPVAVDIPSSRSERVVPSDSIMIITVDKNGAIFFGIDNQNHRRELIEKIANGSNISLTEGEKEKFSTLETFGIPLKDLKTYLNMPGTKMLENQPGIPVDSLNNELRNWIVFAKQVNPGLKIAIKGDRDSDYKFAKDVIATMQDMNLNQFSFVTNLEGKPE